MTTFIIVLLLLMIGHFLCDFTQLSTPKMLSAKKFGYPLEPILGHAALHATYVYIIAIIFTNLAVTLFVGALMWITHSIIDVGKGRISERYPLFTDSSKYPYWWLFGIDQFLHQCILILLAYIITQPL